MCVITAVCCLFNVPAVMWQRCTGCVMTGVYCTVVDCDMTVYCGL